MHQNASLTDFEQFWEQYPRHVGKLDALKAWKKISPDSSLLADILTALAWQTKQPGWVKDAGMYVPHPATWLRGERWVDDAPLPPAMTYYEEWVCPHIPACGHPRPCNLLRALAAARAAKVAMS